MTTHCDSALINQIKNLEGELARHRETSNILSDHDAVQQLLASEKQMGIRHGLRSTPLFIEGIKESANWIEGMMAPTDWSKAEADVAYRFSYILAERLRKSAKQQTVEADSREPLPPASPSPGSASLVDSPEQQIQQMIEAYHGGPVMIGSDSIKRLLEVFKGMIQREASPASLIPETVRHLYDLANQAARNAHDAWEHETPFEVCTNEVCIHARETLDVFTEANANNAAFRDGGYGKEPT